MMSRLLTALPLAATLAFAAPALAADPPERGAMRARVQEKIGAWLTTEIATRVQLDAAKSAKLSEAIKAHLQRKQERGKVLRTEMQKLRGLVDGKASDAQVKAQLDVVLGAASRDDDLHELVRDTSRFMSVQEQARFALAMPEIMKEMRGMMRDARREMRGKRGGFGGPLDDEE